MSKLSANVSKKVPLPGIEFSSRSYSAGMEVEVSSGSGKDELKEKLRSLYALLEESIDEQIKEKDSRGSSTEDPPSRPSPRRSNGPGGNGRRDGNGRGNGNGRTATQAQIKAIYAIAREHGYSDDDLDRLAEGTFGANKPSALSISQASTLIDTLKNDGKE